MYSSKLSKNRVRNPILKVSVESNPDYVLSMVTPASKDWVEFLQMCASQLNFSLDQVVAVDMVGTEVIPLDELETMKKVKHGTEIRITLSPEVSSSSEEEESTEESTEEEVSRRPFDCFQRVSHLKRKNQKLRTALMKVVKRQEWRYLREDGRMQVFENEGGGQRVELNSFLFPSVPATFRLKQLEDFRCCIILCHGGRFSAGVFKGREEIQHKSFSRYVVRKKQGGRQGSRGKSSGGSAGGWLRQFHEKKLREDIIKLLNDWSDVLDGCERIFIHAPGAINQKTVFDPESPISQDDERVKTVPLNLKKAKYEEVKKVHYWLSHGFLVDIKQ